MKIHHQSIVLDKSNVCIYISKFQKLHGELTMMAVSDQKGRTVSVRGRYSFRSVCAHARVMLDWFGTLSQSLFIHSLIKFTSYQSNRVN